MKKITKEQIDETISKVTKEVTQNICDILIENIETYEQSMDKIGNEAMKNYSLYIAAINTASQMSVAIMKRSLYDLLCDEG